MYIFLTGHLWFRSLSWGMADDYNNHTCRSSNYETEQMQFPSTSIIYGQEGEGKAWNSQQETCTHTYLSMVRVEAI